MQASETKLRQLIEGTKQYVVPLFQRPYSWGEKHWKTLFEDVIDQSRQVDSRPHFFGSIVTSPAKSVPQGVGKWLLIDGQQRLTTAQVLLSAIRDAATKAGDTRLAERINGQFLLNAYEHDDEQLKILPTQDDRPAFRAIIRAQSPPPSRLADAYRFFYTRLVSVRPGGARLEEIMTAIADRLSLVGITCEEHDNPHLIFESLNAKGEKLTPADLIRNFLLMRVHVGDQQRVFDENWLPIQQALGDNLTEFVRHYLMKEGKILTEAHVYFELKDRLVNSGSKETEAFLADLRRHGTFYAGFVEPTREPDPTISSALERLRRLESTVTYPLLLRVFDSADRGALTRHQMLELLSVLESFLIRRSICGIPTNQLRGMLPPVFDAAGGAGADLVERIKTQLGGKRCPDDMTFTTALQGQALYSSSKKNARLRLMLERLEESHGHKEPADLATAQIEHVMPQTLTPEWTAELGDDAQNNWARLLHTLGNLTLTGYNADLSNRPYREKRNEYGKSHFELNRAFKDVERWTPIAIERRGHDLAKRALKIWPDLARPNTPEPAGRRITPPPVAVRFRNDTEPVATWKKAAIRLIEYFETASPGLLASVEKKNDLAYLLSRDPERFSRSNAQIGGIYVQMHGSASTLRAYVVILAQKAGFEPDEYEFILPAS